MMSGFMSSMIFIPLYERRISDAPDDPMMRRNLLSDRRRAKAKAPSA
jgi:hypothetical protein